MGSSRPYAAGRRPIRIAAILAERYAPFLLATWIGSPAMATPAAFFCPVISYLQVVPASKQSLAEHVIWHLDVIRQNCRPKTKLGLYGVHMKAINWEEIGSTLEIVKAANANEEFTVLVKGPTAKALVSVLGVAHAAISPATAGLLIAVSTILALAGLTLFALSRGYKVSGKAKTPDGQEYEVFFEPKA